MPEWVRIIAWIVVVVEFFGAAWFRKRNQEDKAHSAILVAILAAIIATSP